MKTKITLLLALFFSIFSFAQSGKTSIKDHINFADLPKQTQDTPSWAIPFYSEPDKINVVQMKKEITDWLKSDDAKKRGEEIFAKEKKEGKKGEFEELKKSITEIPIVRFALNFFKSVPPNWIDNNGFITIKNTTENSANQTNNRSALMPNWTQIGPMETVDSNGTQLPMQSNVYYIAVAPSTPNIRMASTETGALFKTTDSGENWSFLGDYSGPIAFNPTNSSNIILGSNPLRESTNDGLTWETKPVTASCNEIIWSSDGTTIMAASNQGVFTSTNAGDTFSNNLAGNFYDVEFKPGSATIAYAVDVNGNFYKTSNGGTTWQLKTTNYNLNTNKDGYLLGVSASNPNLIVIAFLTGEYVELLKSTDSGETFTHLSTLNSGFSQGFYDFAFGISPVNSNIYYVGVTTLYKSTNGGLNFTALGGYDGNFPIHPDIQDIDFSGTTVVVSTDGGVSVSTDNFTSISNWHSTNKGLFDMELWAFDQGFNTDQMGSGKYHNGDNMHNPNWNNGKTIILGGAEAPVGYSIFSRPNSLFFADIFQGFKQIDSQFNTNVASTFPFSMNSNNYYYGERNSDITSNVVNSNIIYAAYENKVYVSYENGISNQVLRTFGSTVWNIKTTRSNPNVLYVTTESNGLWKTIDGGVNWTQHNFTLHNSNYNANGLQCFIDVSQTNPNELWLAYINWSGNYSVNNSYRIFKSINGGQTWQTLDTSSLNGFTVKEMAHQYGTNGGIYLIGFDSNSLAKCYYRNNSMTNWDDYSGGLLSGSLLGNRIYLKLSHYQEKVRAAGNRGIQEIDFYEPYVAPIAQPTTSQKEVCINQHVQLMDYSILKYSGATWNWSFSKTPIYLNGTSASSQNPEVKFLSTGSVDVTLTVTDSYGISDLKTITNFINVNFDTASCLALNSDEDFTITCTNTIPASGFFNPGNQVNVTNFGGATSGEFIVKINFYNLCYGVVGNLTAIVNLTTDKITVLSYHHFDNSSSTFTGNNTNVITSGSDAFSQISFILTNNILYLNHISNACGGDVPISLQQSCWNVYNGLENGDLDEIQQCNNSISQSENTTGINQPLLVSSFNNATSGLFYVDLNGFTNCNTSTNNLKAIIDLDNDRIHVLSYQHFGSTAIASVTGNETNSVISTSTTNGQVNYYLNNNILYVSRLLDPCGSTYFRVNTSCWSTMDSDGNGIDNTVQPSTCNNPLTSTQFTDANAHQVHDFSSVFSSQNTVFVRLNIGTNCSNATATAYLSLDLSNNVIHVINYTHFGSTSSSTVLNNDSANVYSESAVIGKLKFSLINKVLYIQRLSTDCAGSYYQISDSCFSLASDEILAINYFSTSTISNVTAYPNPTKGLFHIKTISEIDDLELSFYAMDGKNIRPTYKKIGATEWEIDMENYAVGTYFIIAHDKSSNQFNYLKVIKK